MNILSLLLPVLISFYTFGNKVIKISMSKFVFWTSRKMYFAQNEVVREEGRFWSKEVFHTKGTVCQITTGTKLLQNVIYYFKMSFYKIWQ